MKEFIRLRDLAGNAVLLRASEIVAVRMSNAAMGDTVKMATTIIQSGGICYFVMETIEAVEASIARAAGDYAGTDEEEKA